MLLDKSIPYFNVIMKRPADSPILNFELPQGYSFTWFAEGDENYWADIVTAVGEFGDWNTGWH